MSHTSITSGASGSSNTSAYHGLTKPQDKVTNNLTVLLLSFLHAIPVVFLHLVLPLRGPVLAPASREWLASVALQVAVLEGGVGRRVTSSWLGPASSSSSAQRFAGLDGLGPLGLLGVLCE